jgi:WD40 repeat protein
VAGGRSDDAVWIFDVEKNKKVTVMEEFRKLGQITAIALMPDGKRLLTGGYTGIVQVWEFKGGELTAGKQFVGHSTEIKSLACSPNSKFILSGDRDGRMRYWELETCREQQVWADFQSGAKAAHFLADGENALATDGETLFRLNLKTGAVTRTKLDSGNHVAQSAAFNPDSQLLAAGIAPKRYSRKWPARASSRGLWGPEAREWFGRSASPQTANSFLREPRD